MPTLELVADVRTEDEEFELLAFELWHLGSSLAVTEIDQWEEERTAGGRANCL